jgi:putative toxin-antitoxin system antitoxin component (TIGR02293 family)
MAEVTNIGLDVFGDMEKFKQWLDTPSFALGNLKPLDLLTDSYGKEMVMGELTRINHGILA